MKAAQFYIVTAVAFLCLCLTVVLIAMKENAAGKRTLLREQQEIIARGNNAQQSFLKLVKDLAVHTRSSEKIAALLKSHNVTVTAPSEEGLHETSAETPAAR